MRVCVCVCVRACVSELCVVCVCEVCVLIEYLCYKLAFGVIKLCKLIIYMKFIL